MQPRAASPRADHAPCFPRGHQGELVMAASRHVALAAISVALSLATLLTGPARAQAPAVQAHPLSTQTLSQPEVLKGSRQGRPDSIAGTLRIPGRPGRMPAMVLMHGIGGMGVAMDVWAEKLNAMGVATFAMDSFAGRPPATPAPVSPLARVVDAYKALELLAAHPRIDAARIGVMGFSHGGAAALYTSLNRFARQLGPADGRRFAAHVVFYPGCNQSYREDEDVTGSPIRIFHGAADDWLPASACREYAARLRKAGRDAVFTEYEGALHSFDNPGLKQPVRL